MNDELVGYIMRKTKEHCLTYEEVIAVLEAKEEFTKNYSQVEQIHSGVILDDGSSLCDYQEKIKAGDEVTFG